MEHLHRWWIKALSVMRIGDLGVVDLAILDLEQELPGAQSALQLRDSVLVDDTSRVESFAVRDQNLRLSKIE